MKIKDLKEIKNKSGIEILKLVEIMRKEIADLVIETSIGKVKNVHLKKAKKKTIAQLLTIANHKLLEEKKGSKNG